MAVVPTSSQGGQVTSVFARTGAVVAATNDYTDAQVQNSPTNILTAGGDILYASAANTLAKLAKGSDGALLTLASGIPSWTGSAGNFTRLSNTVLGGSGTFDVSSISQSYSDLLCVLVARGTNASASDNCDIRFNNDSSAHYGSVRLGTSGASGQFGEQNSTTSAYVLVSMQANTATAGQFAMGWVYIPGYSSATWPKMFVCLNMYGTAITTGTRTITITQGYWNQTSAINRIQVFGDTTANLATGSYLNIYGIT